MGETPQRRRMDEPKDADVIARVLGGATQEFAILVGRYQHALYRHAVAMVLDHDAAEDMVQDAFIRGYTRLRECREPEHFRAWIFQTLRNRCLDYLKEPRRRQVPIDDVQPLYDTADDPGAVAERRQTASRIAATLATLSPEQRETFVMHYVDGMSYDDMSALLGVSVSALKMRALRARDALSAALRDDVTRGARSSSLYQGAVK
jgi:RNA polymerase sigma-70 factor (ECF subfamily)